MPPPLIPGADWPVLKYGQSDPNNLPPEQFVESMQGAMAEKNSPFQAQEMITEAKK